MIPSFSVYFVFVENTLFGNLTVHWTILLILVFSLTCTWECPSCFILQGTCFSSFGCRALFFFLFFHTTPRLNSGNLAFSVFFPTLLGAPKNVFYFTLISKLHTRGATVSKKRTNRFPSCGLCALSADL